MAPPDLSLELAAAGPVAGLDEVGRGPLAGPVVAAAVILELSRIPPGIDDSKALTAAARAAIFAALHESGARIGIGCASVREIDRRNILGASLLAMRRALSRLGTMPRLALVDGNRAPDLPCPVRTVVGGDRLSLSIAAASIVAKVTRDRLMARLGRAYPAFGWEYNAGYATPAHLVALDGAGPTPHHRRGFAPVRQLRLPLSL
ncbi:MAG: ribonuclease HII [Alphaproteobacteria bacterium]|nr:ribonuclease HII [Alphaproteobacteria bacterium]